MRLEGSFTVRRAREEVLEFFTDPHRLVDCLDDPHTLDEVEPPRFAGTLTTGVGWLRGTFHVSGAYGPVVPPHRAEVRIQGRGLGSGLDGHIVVEVEDEPGGTRVGWHADVTFSGPVAALGDRILRGTAEKKTRALFERARERLEATR